MIDTVNHIADIVQPTGNFRQFRLSLTISQCQKDFPRFFRDLADMRKTVLSIAQRRQSFIRFLNVRSDLGIISDLFNGDHRVPPFPSFAGFPSLPLLWTNTGILIGLLDQHALLRHGSVGTVKPLDRQDHGFAVLDAGSFVAGMHRQLSQSDIDGSDTNLRSADTAQRTAAL